MYDFSTVLTVIATGMTVLVTLLGTVWKISQYVRENFDAVKDLINKKIDNILEKLDLHEEMDNRRFADIHEAIWHLRLQTEIQKALGKTIDRSEELEKIATERGKTIPKRPSGI